MRMLVPALLSLVACEADPVALDWRVAFDDPSTADETLVLDLAIHDGSCDGPERQTWQRTREATASVRVELPPGRYALRARARNAACAWFAEACDVVRLPRTTRFDQIVRRSATPTERCPASRCAAGLCVAAPIDAGLDSGALDAGEPDAGEPDAGATDAGFDAGPVDGGFDGGVDAGPCGDGIVGCCTVDREGMPCGGGGSAAGGPPGTCFRGACCTGCVLEGVFGGPSCEPGTEPGACGVEGGGCIICVDREICTAEGMCSGSPPGGA